jgi:hypothetical protein
MATDGTRTKAIGADCVIPPPALTPEHLIAQADQAPYAANKQRHDRWCMTKPQHSPSAVLVKLLGARHRAKSAAVGN